MLARKAVQFGACQRRHVALGLGAHRQMHLARRELAQHLDSGLQVVFLLAKHEVVVRGQRRRIERRNKDCPGRVRRVGDDAVGALHDHRPQAAAQQQFHNFLARGRTEVRTSELFRPTFAVGGHRHGEHLAFFAAVDGRHTAAHRRGEKYALVVLVEEQRRTRLHLIARLDQQLGGHALEIEGRNRILRSPRRIGHGRLRFPLQIDVETLA